MAHGLGCGEHAYIIFNYNTHIVSDTSPASEPVLDNRVN